LALFAPSVVAPLADAQAVVAAARTTVVSTRRPLRVMVVGDSTGTAFARGLAAAGDPRMLVDDATAPCPIFPGSFSRWYARAPMRDLTGCGSIVARWIARARTFHPQLVLVIESVEDASDFAAARNAPARSNVIQLPLEHVLMQRYDAVAALLRTTGAVVA